MAEKSTAPLDNVLATKHATVIGNAAAFLDALDEELTLPEQQPQQRLAASLGELERVGRYHALDQRLRRAAVHARTEAVRVWRDVRTLVLARSRARRLLVLVALLGAIFMFWLFLSEHLVRFVRCNWEPLDEPLWDADYDDWTLAHELFADQDVRQFARQSKAYVEDGEPMLVTFATAAFAPLVHHWACRAKDAGLRPHAVALDDSACAVLNASAPWLPCLRPRHLRHRLQGDATSAISSEALLVPKTPLYHVAMTLRSEMTWRLLAHGVDLLVSDADVVFMPNATGVRFRDYVAPHVDVQTMQDSPSGLWGYAVRTLVDAYDFVYPNFGFVYARASERTVALFQLLHYESALSARSDDQRIYATCVRSPFRSLRVAMFDRVAFPEGQYVYGDATWPVYGYDAATFAKQPVAAHLTSVDSARKRELLGAYNMWSPCCGKDVPLLPYAVDQPLGRAPRFEWTKATCPSAYNGGM